MADWSLNRQLEQDTINIGDLPLSRVLVVNDGNYPWLMLVPRRANAKDLVDLNEVEPGQLMTEINRVARALQDIVKPDKLNIAALGNMVPQLHIHVIARRTTDPAWPRPVWGVVPPVPHDPHEIERFIRELRSQIWLS